MGVQISKSSIVDADPSDGILHDLKHHPADLIVLATHQRHGLDRWMHATIAGRINNQTDGATLFIPFGHPGFVDEQSGECHLAIREEAEQEAVDLVVMTTSGRHGFFDALRGSTTEQVVAHARYPVLAVHAWSD